MKILQRDLKHGKVVLVPETLDDLWHLFNIVTPKDEVRARTTRLVKVDELYARPKKGKRVSVFLGVKVEKVSWDRSLNRLRIHGTISEAPEELNITGSHHTINVRVDKPITIFKFKWPKHQIDRLDRATRVTAAPLILISIDDEEYCVSVLRQYGIDVRAEERTRLPGKLEPKQRVKAMQEFFKSALKSLQQVWMDLRSPIVIMGPGFIKNDFFKYMRSTVSDIANTVIDVKGVNSGGLAGIHEALRAGILTKALRNMRIVEETRVVEEVLARLGKGRLDVTYGFTDVKSASLFGAVEKLLVTDVTLREAADEKRLAMEELMKNVEEKGGEIMVLSSEHEAGAKLLALGGVVALLRFPLGQTITHFQSTYKIRD